jgi:uncharacterized protein
MSIDRGDDEDLEETLEETFPASDAPANTPETGIRLGDVTAPSSDAVTDNPARNRFELTVDGQTAFLLYERTPQTLTLVHTEVPRPLRGRHLGDELVKAALQNGRSHGLRIIAVCPFARAYMRRHPPARA